MGITISEPANVPVCPVCETQNKPEIGFLAGLAAPARRALQSKAINSAEILAQYTKSEILSLHGMGPSSLPKLQKVLEETGLNFKSHNE